MQRVALVLLAVLGIGAAAFFFLESGEGELPVDGLDGREAAVQDADSEDLRAAGAGEADAAGGGSESSDGRAAREDDRRASGPIVTIVGRVSRRSGAKGVAGAKVSLRYDKHNPIDGSFRLRKGNWKAPEASWKAEADAQGRFQLTVPAPLEAKFLRITAPRLVTFEKELANIAGAEASLRAGGKIDLGDLGMQAGIVLQGRVVDAFGKGVKGAALTFATKKDKSSIAMRLVESYGSAGMAEGAPRSGDNGRFELVLERPGEYVVRATHEEYVAGETAVEIEELGEVRSGVLIRFAASGEIRGVLSGLDTARDEVEIRAQKVDPDKSDTIFARLGSTLAWGKKRSDIAEDGGFRVAGLEQGAEYRIAAFTRSEQPFGRVQVSRAAMAMCGARGIQLAYQGGVVVVFDAVTASGAKIESVRATPRLAAAGGEVDVASMLASLGRGAKSIERSADGRFHLEALRPKNSEQKLTLTLEAEGYRQLVKSDIALPERGLLDLGVLRLEEAPTLTVEVVDALGKAVEGAKVQFLRVQEGEAVRGRRVVRRSVRVRAGSSGPVASNFGLTAKTPTDKTDEDGIAELLLSSYLKGQVFVKHADFADQKSEVMTLAARGDSKHRVRLSAGGIVEVAALDPRGQPVAGAKLRCIARKDEGTITSFSGGKSRVTDDAGRARFVGLPAGEYDVHFEEKRSGPLGRMSFRVSASSDDAADKKPPFKGERAVVLDGQTTRVTLRQLAKSTLRGVVSLDGAPLSGARVRLDNGSGTIEAMFESMGGGFGSLLGSRRGKKGKTDRDGNYELEDVKVGTRKLAVSHPKLAMPHRVEVRVVEGTTQFDIAIRMTTVAGVVVDEGGNPVAGAVVTIEKANMSDTERALQGSSRVLVAAVDSAGGKRLAGGSPVNTTVSVVTKEDGTFLIPGVAPDQDAFVVAKPKKLAEVRSQKLRFREGEKRTGVRLVAERGGAIEITMAKSASGLGIVSLIPAGSEGRAGMRTARLKDGRALVEGLKRGTWTVAPIGLQGQQDSKDVVVETGKTAQVAF